MFNIIAQITWIKRALQFIEEYNIINLVAELKKRCKTKKKLLLRRLVDTEKAIDYEDFIRLSL